MAQATYSVTTGSSDLSQIWRKVQYGIVVAAQFGVEEWNALQELKAFDVNWSSREITMELDVLYGTGASAIPEGGKEARPSSPTAVDATISWIFLNKRFTISKTSQYIQQQQGVKGALEGQLKWQAKKALQAVRQKVGDMFYGFSTGTIAKISSVSVDDIVLKDLYGISGLGGATDNRRAVDLFTAGAAPNCDYIAVLNPAGPALRAGGIQPVTAKNRSTNTITAGASGITTPTANDLIVFANNLENTTLAGGTERNLNFVGILDGMTSTSVHSVSGATYAPWNTASADTAGGRFTGIKLRKMKQAIENVGGGTLDRVIWSNGVENDVVAQLQAGLRFTDAYAMEMDGAPKSKGVTFFTSRRVPDGYAFAFDKSNSVNRMTLLPEPGTPGFEDGDKLQDDSGMMFSLDYPAAMIWTNRANTAYASSLTQQ